jgi:Uma2 family endonuclease
MTASLSQSHHDHTFVDYLALERDSEIKHEFDEGEILAMSGGTARHSALAAKIVTAMETTRAPGCTVFTSDMRVRVAATGRATYPDVSMVRGPIEYDPEDAARTTMTCSSSKSSRSRPRKAIAATSGCTISASLRFRSTSW